MFRAAHSFLVETTCLFTNGQNRTVVFGNNDSGNKQLLQCAVVCNLKQPYLVDSFLRGFSVYMYSSCSDVTSTCHFGTVEQFSFVLHLAPGEGVVG